MSYAHKLMPPSQSSCDDDRRQLRQKMSKEVNRLSALDSRQTYRAILFDWLVIVIAIYAMQAYSQVLVYVIGIFLIGGRQHALFVITHEGAHKLVHKNLWLNDLITDLFCAFPIFIRTEAYRNHHLKHHKFLNTDKDPDWKRKIVHPDWKFPQSSYKFMSVCSKYLLGYGAREVLLFIYALGALGERHRTYKVMLRLAYYLLIGFIFTYYSLWPAFFLCWLIPYVVILPLLNRIRSIAEHFALEYKDSFSQSRNVYGSPLERLLVCPHNVGLHLDHHLYPSIPFYHLPQLNKSLLSHKAYRSKGVANYGYFSRDKRSLLHDILLK